MKKFYKPSPNEEVNECPTFFHVKVVDSMSGEVISNLEFEKEDIFLRENQYLVFEWDVLVWRQKCWKDVEVNVIAHDTFDIPLFLNAFSKGRRTPKLLPINPFSNHFRKLFTSFSTGRDVDEGK